MIVYELWNVLVAMIKMIMFFYFGWKFVDGDKSEIKTLYYGIWLLLVLV